MSATLDAQKFSTYFAGCPVVNIPGQSFPVEVSKYFTYFKGSSAYGLIFHVF